MATKTIQVVEHNGSVQTTVVEDYNALETFKALKAAQTSGSGDNFVVIGDIIIDARTVAKVVVVPEEPVVEPDPVPAEEPAADPTEEPTA